MGNDAGRGVNAAEAARRMADINLGVGFFCYTKHSWRMAERERGDQKPGYVQRQQRRVSGLARFLLARELQQQFPGAREQHSHKARDTPGSEPYIPPARNPEPLEEA